MRIQTTMIAFCAAAALMAEAALAQSQSQQQQRKSQQQGSSQQQDKSQQQGSSQQGSSQQQGAFGPQGKSGPGVRQPSTLGGDRGLAMQPGQYQVLFRASQLIGNNVQSPQGQNLGKLAEIVFDPQVGVFGVINTGNQRMAAVPWSLVTAVTGKSIVLNTTAQALNGGPIVSSQTYQAFNNPTFTQRIYQYYNVKQQGMGGSGGASQQGSSSGATGQQSGAQQSGSEQSQGSQSSGGQKEQP